MRHATPKQSRPVKTGCRMYSLRQHVRWCLGPAMKQNMSPPLQGLKVEDSSVRLHDEGQAAADFFDRFSWKEIGLKHVPNGREELKTVRDWDPRTQEGMRGGAGSETPKMWRTNSTGTSQDRARKRAASAKESSKAARGRGHSALTTLWTAR